MSMDNPGGVNWIKSDHPRQARIMVEDLLDALIARASRALQPNAVGAGPSELTTQVQQMVQLAQQLKDAVGKVRQLDPSVLADNRDAVA